MTKKIPLAKPYIPSSIFKILKKVINSGFLTEGHFTNYFESLITNYVNCKYCITFTSATTALDSVIKSLNFNDKSEIIAPDFTYPATIIPALLNGVKVRLVDVDIDTFNICTTNIKKNINKQLKAIIPVSVFGNAIEFENLKSILPKEVKIIEDAAASLGTKLRNKKVGNFADFSIFSLHPRKSITSGEGGFVTLNNYKNSLKLKQYKNFGLSTKKKFITLGTNYKFSNINAAFVISQMELIEKILNKKRKLASRYLDLLSKNRNIHFQKVTPSSVHSYQTFCILVNNRDILMDKLLQKGIETQIGYYSLSNLLPFKNNKNVIINEKMKNSEYLYRHTLALPLYYEMTKSEQNYVIKTINEFT